MSYQIESNNFTEKFNESKTKMKSLHIFICFFEGQD